LPSAIEDNEGVPSNVRILRGRFGNDAPLLECRAVRAIRRVVLSPDQVTTGSG